MPIIIPPFHTTDGSGAHEDAGAAVGGGEAHVVHRKHGPATEGTLGARPLRQQADVHRAV